MSATIQNKTRATKMMNQHIKVIIAHEQTNASGKEAP